MFIYLKKWHYPILAVNVILIIIFSILYLKAKNVEFIIFVGIIIFLLGLIVFTNKKVRYSYSSLIGLSIWAAMHMAGGILEYNGRRWYDQVLIPFYDGGGDMRIFKYDQLVHMIAFGSVTMVMYEIIRPHLKPTMNKFVALSIVIVAAGLGMGALNEIVEFIITLIDKNSGIGGYENSSLDLIFNGLGGIIAMVYILLSIKFRGRLMPIEDEIAIHGKASGEAGPDDDIDEDMDIEEEPQKKTKGKPSKKKKDK